MTNGTAISKLELLHLFQKYTDIENIIINPSVEKIANKSLMKSAKIEFDILPYNEMIDNMISWIKKKELLYQHYELN